MASGNIYRKVSEIGRLDFDICKWTDRQTNTLMAILCTRSN